MVSKVLYNKTKNKYRKKVVKYNTISLLFFLKNIEIIYEDYLFTKKL